MGKRQSRNRVEEKEGMTSGETEGGEREVFTFFTSQN
jgi:hypothetical protein